MLMVIKKLKKKNFCHCSALFAFAQILFSLLATSEGEQKSVGEGGLKLEQRARKGQFQERENCYRVELLGIRQIEREREKAGQWYESEKREAGRTGQQGGWLS